MSPKAAAVIGLRIIGLWFVLEPVVELSGFFTNRMVLEAMSGIHRRDYIGGGVVPPTDLYAHDTYYVISHIPPGLAGAGISLVIGLILLLASKPLARIVARGLDAF